MWDEILLVNYTKWELYRWFHPLNLKSMLKLSIQTKETKVCYYLRNTGKGGVNGLLKNAFAG